MALISRGKSSKEGEHRVFSREGDFGRENWRNYTSAKGKKNKNNMANGVQANRGVSDSADSTQ